MFGQLADAGRCLAQIVHGVHQLLLVFSRQQLVSTLRGIVQLGQQAGALVGQARHQAGAHGDPRWVVVGAGQRLFGFARVIQLDEGQPGNPLKAQAGKRRFGDGCGGIHGNADAHVATDFLVQRNGLHAAHGYALEAHAGLALQAGYALTARDFEQAVFAAIAR